MLSSSENTMANFFSSSGADDQGPDSSHLSGGGDFFSSRMPRCSRMMKTLEDHSLSTVPLQWVEVTMEAFSSLPVRPRMKGVSLIVMEAPLRLSPPSSPHSQGRRPERSRTRALRRHQFPNPLLNIQLVLPRWNAAMPRHRSWSRATLIPHL